MMKKDYEIIAKAFAAVGGNVEASRGWTPQQRAGARDVLDALAQRLCYEFKIDNDRFDKEKFLVAANQKP